jgi:hypothetical protein
MSDRDLKDTGVPRDLVAHEARKWPWQSWHPQLHAFEEAAQRRTLGQHEVELPRVPHRPQAGKPSDTVE